VLRALLRVSRGRRGPLPARQDGGVRCGDNTESCDVLGFAGPAGNVLVACPQSARLPPVVDGSVIGPVESPHQEAPVVTGMTLNTADSAAAGGPAL